MSIRPVLILDGTPRVVCTIARSLLRSGVPVAFAALPGSPQQVIRSRALKHCFQLFDEPEELKDNLMSLVAQYRFDMVIPGSDVAMVLLGSCHQELSRVCTVCCPPASVAERVLNKAVTMALAERCGVLTPRSYAPLSVAGLPELESALTFPLVAKPRSKAVEARYAVRYIHSLGELRQSMERDPEFARNFLLQEYCPGYGIGVEMLMWEGRVVTVFQHRRLKELPYTGGVSVVCESQAPDPALVQAASDLLRQLEWEGPAMVEFRYDPAAGKAVLMEVNGRYWGSLPLSVRAGIDFPLYHWQFLHAQTPQPPDHYRSGIRVRWTAGAISRCLGIWRAHAAGSLSHARLARELVGLIGDGWSARDALWAFSDPLPALGELPNPLALARKILPPKLRRILRVCRDFGFRVGVRYALSRWRARRAPNLPGTAPKSVLFVCSGNIIRSPMAEMLLQRELGATSPIVVKSAGVLAKPGSMADQRAILIGREFGIALDQHRAQPFSQDLLEQSDLICVMDYLNWALLLERYPEAAPKVVLLADGEIEDPYAGSPDDIRQCYRFLHECITKLSREWRLATPCESSMLSEENET
jgi:protein-tyrosine-phosphatase/predicted ATP-grasp superfamily ATP-dependent carboligase